MAQALHLPSFLALKQSRHEQQPNRRQWSGVRSLQSPTWLKEIYDRISALEALKENWDSHGGLPMADGATAMIRVVLSKLDIEDMPKPHIAPLPDGGIGLHWRVVDRDLELEVESSGEVHALRGAVGGDSKPYDVLSLQDVQGHLDWVLGR